MNRFREKFKNNNFGPKNYPIIPIITYYTKHHFKLLFNVSQKGKYVLKSDNVVSKSVGSKS